MRLLSYGFGLMKNRIVKEDCKPPVLRRSYGLSGSSNRAQIHIVTCATVPRHVCESGRSTMQQVFVVAAVGNAALLPTIERASWRAWSVRSYGHGETGHLAMGFSFRVMTAATACRLLPLNVQRLH